MENQKENLEELSFSYLPNTNSTKSVAKEEPIVLARPMTVKEKVKDFVARLKQKGKIPANLKNVIVKASAGSLVALMLLSNLASCANSTYINPSTKTTEEATQQTTESSSESLTDEETTGSEIDIEDYEAKKQAFLMSDPKDIKAGLQVVPENYYLSKGLTQDQIDNQVLSYEQFYTKKALHIIGIFYPDDCLETDGKVLMTWFSYEIGEDKVNELLNLFKNSTTRCPDGQSMSIVPRRDRINNFEYRYALDKVLQQTPKIVGENYTRAGDISSKRFGSFYVIDQDSRTVAGVAFGSPIITCFSDNCATSYFIGTVGKVEDHNNPVFLCKLIDSDMKTPEEIVNKIPYVYEYKSRSLRNLMANSNLEILDPVIERTISACELSEIELRKILANELNK